MAHIAGMHPSDSPDYRRLKDLCIETLGFVPNSVLMMLRVALELALAVGQVPNAVGDALFRRLRAYWNEEQILEIVGVVAMFGFLNRSNDTLAMPLEEPPVDVAKRHLAPHGWTPGKYQT